MHVNYAPIAAIVVAIAGCSNSKPLPMTASSGSARPALQTALNAWKAGRTPIELRNQSPPVFFNDADFSGGRKLADYRIENDGKPVGTGLRYEVTLTLQTGPKPITRKLAYRVATVPTISIFREDS